MQIAEYATPAVHSRSPCTGEWTRAESRVTRKIISMERLGLSAKDVDAKPDGKAAGPNGAHSAS